MIKAVTVVNHIGESIKMELGSPEKSGFLIQNITGLGPPKASINSTEFATSDGGIFNSARVDSRNIVFSFILLGTPSIEATRQKAYKYFPIKKRVRLIFETDLRACETYGYVESNEPNIFTQKETIQVSVICPDPYFYSIRKNVTLFAGIEGAFEFPFENNSLEDDLLIMGEITTMQEKVIYYTGDADVGFKIIIHAVGEATGLNIYNLTTREVMKINTDKLEVMTGHPIIRGDDIIISTVRGDKYIQLVRDGEYVNILNCLDKDAAWFQLVKGDNVFIYTAETGELNLQFRIENQILYEGV